MDLLALMREHPLYRRMSDKERDERLMRQLAWAYYRATPPEEMSDPSDKVTP